MRELVERVAPFGRAPACDALPLHLQRHRRDAGGRERQAVDSRASPRPKTRVVLAPSSGQQPREPGELISSSALMSTVSVP